jgi:hypothetical protein
MWPILPWACAPAVPDPLPLAAPAPLEGTPGEPEPVVLDLAVLDRVNPANWNGVFSWLASDCRFRVTEHDHAIVALFREPDGDAWTVPHDGYHRDATSVRRALFRFTAWDEQIPWTHSARVSRVDATATTLDVVPFVAGPPYDGWAVRAVAIEGRDLTLETHEARAPGEAREWGGELRAEAKRVVEDILAGRSDEVHAARRGASEATIVHTERGWEWRAWINPGAPGWVWVHLDPDSGWDAAAVEAATREAVGWSTDAGETFYMQGSLPPPIDNVRSVTAEVWLQAAGAAEAVGIGRWEVDVVPAIHPGTR